MQERDMQDVAGPAEEFGEVLEQLHSLHGSMQEAIQMRADAIRQADAEGLREAIGSESSVLEDIRRVDARRIELAGELTGTEAPRVQSLSMSNVLESIEDDVTREHLDQLSVRLRQQIKATQNRSAIVRQAAETLMGHIDGVMQSVRSAMETVGRYGPDGSLHRSQTGSVSLDITS